jgi:hypothetical protein
MYNVNCRVPTKLIDKFSIFNISDKVLPSLATKRDMAANSTGQCLSHWVPRRIVRSSDRRKCVLAKEYYCWSKCFMCKCK